MAMSQSDEEKKKEKKKSNEKWRNIPYAKNASWHMA